MSTVASAISMASIGRRKGAASLILRGFTSAGRTKGHGCVVCIAPDDAGDDGLGDPSSRR